MSQREIRILSSPVPGVFATCSASGRHFDRHWHDAYGFGVLDRGAQSWRSRRGIVDAYSGAVINTVPGEVHDGRPLGVDRRHWRILTVSPETMKAVTAHARRDVEISRPVLDDAQLAFVLRRAFRLLQRWADGERADSDALAFDEVLVESCALLVARHGAPAAPAAAVDRDVALARDRLADDLCSPPSLAQLAAMVGLSRFQLLRRFTTRYGLPPHAWLLRRRAERALALIRRGETLGTTAAIAGFADQSHMTRTFVRFYGYTPGQWASAHRAS